MRRTTLTTADRLMLCGSAFVTIGSSTPRQHDYHRRCLMPTERCPTCKRRIKRSTEANRRYWAVLHALAENLRPNGQVFSDKAYHEWAKSKFLGCDEVKLPNGATLVIPHSTADLDSGAFAEYATQVEAYANERGVYLEDMEPIR